MKRNRVGVAVIALMLSACTMNYRLDGNTYSGEEQFQAGADALYSSTRQQIVSTMRVSEPISKKRLTIGLPTIDTIKDGFIMPNILQVTPAQLMQRDAFSRAARKEYEMFASTVKDLGIYQDVRTVDTTGGHIQPSSTDSVLYMYVLPQSNAFQWYINGGKPGLQTVNIDRGQPKFLGRATSIINSIKGYALTD